MLCSSVTSNVIILFLLLVAFLQIPLLLLGIMDDLLDLVLLLKVSMQDLFSVSFLMLLFFFPELTFRHTLYLFSSAHQLFCLFASLLHLLILKSFLYPWIAIFFISSPSKTLILYNVFLHISLNCLIHYLYIIFYLFFLHILDFTLFLFFLFHFLNLLFIDRITIFQFNFFLINLILALFWITLINWLWILYLRLVNTHFLIFFLFIIFIF